jgi:hypothetical protein
MLFLSTLLMEEKMKLSVRKIAGCHSFGLKASFSLPSTGYLKITLFETVLFLIKASSKYWIFLQPQTPLKKF